MLSLPVLERFVLTRFGEATALAVYIPIYDLVFRAFTFLLVPVSMAVHPRLSRLVESGNQEAAFRLLRAALGLQVLMGIVLVLLLGVSAGFVIGLLGIALERPRPRH